MEIAWNYGPFMQLTYAMRTIQTMMDEPTLPREMAYATDPDAGPGGHYAELTTGRCHYRYDGPVDGRPILLIHGATVAAWEFDRIVPYLHREGWRTLRADLFGHGRSARPFVSYEHALFVRQQIELLDYVGARSPLPVLGHSLGAALVARLLAQAPSRFASAVMGAPLVDFIESTPAARWLCRPLVGELLMPVYVLPMLKRRRRRNYRAIDNGHFARAFMQQFELPGFGRALLSMFRSGALGDQLGAYRDIARSGHTVLVLRGAQDPIVSAAQIARVLDAMPRARYRELPDMGHAFPLSHPGAAAAAILEFLAETRG